MYDDPFWSVAYPFPVEKMNSFLLFFVVFACVFGHASADVICDGTRLCKNNGQCIGEIDANGTLTTECRCFPPFTGRLCEAYECPSNPCRNNGSCEYDGKYFRCTCPRFYIGDFCELRQPTACDAIECGNGECSLAHGRLEVPVCKCHKGFTGVNCHQIDHCKPESCSGHGECINHQSDFSCKCDVGFEGQFCEDNIDECVYNACAVGSTCIDNVAGYECICPPGKVGPLCQFDDPCVNDFIVCGPGTCFSTIRGEPVCRCPEGLYGKFCQLDIDECAFPNKCSENGECRNTHGSYFCVCDDGFYGDSCESEVSYQAAAMGPRFFDPVMTLAVVASILITSVVLLIVKLMKRCISKLRKSTDIEIYNCFGETAFYEVTVVP
uniref:Delta-like protein n=1 Tax=Panagrellus redivivus TaxID=6233 RepID=A0A7E4URY0_PANRE